MQFLETDWERPDEGIWEVRGPKRQFTHSKVMAWVAADRAVKAVEMFGLPGDSRSLAQASPGNPRPGLHVMASIQTSNSFVQYYGSREPDASLLMLPLVGFLPATDPRIIGTVNYIQKRSSATALSIVSHGSLKSTGFRRARARSYSALFGWRTILPSRADRQRRGKSSSVCSAFAMTWASCQNSTTPTAAALSATSRKPSLTSALSTRPGTLQVPPDPRKPAGETHGARGMTEHK